MANIDAFNPETWSDTERIYFKYVDRAIKDREDQRFSNGNPWHAVYLIAAFFKKAKHHIRLFSGELTRQTEDGFKIYADPHVIEAAWLFLLDPKSKLEIVLEKDIDVSEGQSPTDHPLVKGILDMPITTLIRETSACCGQMKPHWPPSGGKISRTTSWLWMSRHGE